MSGHLMTDRERMIAIMNHQPVDRVIWQPRLEHWYNVNKGLGRLPKRYRDMTLLELYDDLGTSIRSYHFYNPCITRLYDADISFPVVEETDTRRIRLWKTPLGTLTQVDGKTKESSLCREFPIKTIRDIEIVKFIIEHTRFDFDFEKFAQAERTVAHRAAGVVFNQRIPLQRLYIEYMGFENTIVALHEFPNEMEGFIRFMEERDQQYFDMIKATPLELLNFGDNVDANMLPPSFMDKWALPYYRRRTRELLSAGKRSYPHWDGALKGLLKYVPQCGFDGYEAFTPEPMGDVSLEEIAEVMKHDYVLIDGIPATHFLSPFTRDEVEEFAYKVLDLFAPSLILGISDELPPGGDIEAVRMVSQIVRDYVPKRL